MPVGHSPVFSRKKPTTPTPSTGQAENRAERHPSQTSQDLKATGGVVTCEGDVTKEEENLEVVGGPQAGATSDAATGEIAGMEKDSSKLIGKLDESVYRKFGQQAGSVSSLSRSSSDTGSEGAICHGGPNKNCGNQVKEGEAGVQCDKCFDWFHTSCQAIPKPAIKALEKFECLAWLCASCKSELKNKNRRAQIQLNESLETKINQLEESLKSHMELVSNSIRAQENLVQDQASKVEKSLHLCEKLANEQVKALEKSFQRQTASYADAVKGTCNEVTKVVQSQMALLPKSSAVSNKNDAQDLSRALDEHMDREKRKANLVIHNLPEQEGNSFAERSEKDLALFTSMIKDVLKLRVSSSRSFRVGKKQENRPRLLIVTLDNPASKHDILKCAPQLRNSAEYGNIYISPDLTQKEREVNRKLREELASRRRAGESNLIIRGGRIIPGPARDSSSEFPSVGHISCGDEGSIRQLSKPFLHQPSGTHSDNSTVGVIAGASGGQTTDPAPNQSSSTQGSNIPAVPPSDSIGQPDSANSNAEATPETDAGPVVLTQSSGSDLRKLESSELRKQSAESTQGREGPSSLSGGVSSEPPPQPQSTGSNLPAAQAPRQM